MELHKLLDLPYGSSGRPLEGRRLINILLSVLADALNRGESISVRGLGKFKVVQWRGSRSGANYIAAGRQRSPVVIDHPPRKRVIFQPSEQLLAMLNLGTTWDEKRAMEIWNK